MRDPNLLGLAEEFGTPLYVYDADLAAERAGAVKAALEGRAELYYAAKANPNPLLLGLARGWAEGLDVSSGGEFEAARTAGWDPGRMSLAGPGKTPGELDAAVGGGCGSVSMESRDDLEGILAAGERTGRKPRISLRVNPLELAGPFALKMGGKPTQFGVDEEDASEALGDLLRAVREGRAEYEGLHIYAGTQCLDAAALVGGVENSLRIARDLERACGIPAPRINLGGGFGVAYYEGQSELDLAEAGRGIVRALDAFRAERPETRFVLELGRFLVGPAGWYLTRILALKKSRGKTFAVADGGMHHNLSASGNLGQTMKRNYRMRNLSRPAGAVGPVELAGCLCTPIDLLGVGAPLGEVRKGDVVALENSGAYGYTASPLYFLGHETPREVVLSGGKAILARESYSPFEPGRI